MNIPASGFLNLAPIEPARRVDSGAAFIREMIRNPEFICWADDIVVEFGNSITAHSCWQDNSTSTRAASKSALLYVDSSETYVDISRTERRR